jgi:hypothetical protein
VLASFSAACEARCYSTERSAEFFSDLTFLSWVDFEFGLAVATGVGSCVGREADGVDDRAEREDGHQEDGLVKVAELGSRG